MMTMRDFIRELDARVAARRKMTSPLYQCIMAGKATQRLLMSFVIHRYPIKDLWTRNILGIASRVDDYGLRVELVENIYEEETGRLTQSQRHLDSFARFGVSTGVSMEMIRSAPMLPETRAVMDHNLEACNDSRVHFTAGVASVLLLMEGQPPIVTGDRRSMLSVMRDVYCLPPEGYEFFVHHASSSAESSHVSQLEDDHASVARELLQRYCEGPELQEQARSYLERALDRRHAHFDAIFRDFYDASEPVFCHARAA